MSTNEVMKKVASNIYVYLEGTQYSATAEERSKGKEAYLISVTVKGVRKTRRIIGFLDDVKKVRDSLKTGMEVGLMPLQHQEKVNHILGKRKRKNSLLSSEDVSSWTLEHALKKTNELFWNGTSGGVNASRNGKFACKFFGADRRLDDITMEDVDDYISHLRRQGNSEATINRKLSALSKMYTVALERNKCTKKLPLPRLREAQHRIRFISKAEETRLISIMNNKGYYDHADAALILLYTGFRTSELWKLDCKDIDLDKKIILLWKTKNGRPRSVPIVDIIYPIIERKYKDVGGVGRLFPKSNNSWFRNGWDRAREIMGLSDDPQFVPHILRHTCATRLSQHGVSLPIIKDWLGHTSIATTSRYAHFNPQDLFRAGELLTKG